MVYLIREIVMSSLLLKDCIVVSACDATTMMMMMINSQLHEKVIKYIPLFDFANLKIAIWKMSN